VVPPAHVQQVFFCRDVQFVLQFWHFFCICTCINFFYDKPIGAVPGRNYVVVKRMVRTTINLVFYNIIRYDTSKKGENAPLGLRIKRANRWFNPPQASLLLRDEDDRCPNLAGASHWLSSSTQSAKSACLNITQGCQHPTNVMMYTTAAKTDKPTDWKALWISFGDVAFSKKNDSHGHRLWMGVRKV